MVLTGVLEKKTEADERQIDAFFTKLSTPIDVEKTHAKITGEVFSPFKIIGWVTAGTGVMLLISGFAQPADIGRYINLGAGFTLCLLGAGLYRLHRKFMRQAETESSAKVKFESERVEKAIE